ncbi:hypothetical protein [Dactylosporangium sp. CA-233914]|uniref:hypothetical protein n=1 Tax=Dactylosporangium sp. CA-233914 TaxID=3239934 RepID=UPI003D8C8A4F
MNNHDSIAAEEAVLPPDRGTLPAQTVPTHHGSVRGGSSGARPAPPARGRPWYLEEQALGQTNVVSVGRAGVADPDALAGQFVAELPAAAGTPALAGATVEQRRAIDDFLRETITGLLSPPARRPGRDNLAHDAFLERWDQVLFQGVHGVAGGRLVWVRPVIGAVSPVDPEPGPRVFKVSFGSTAISSSSAGGRATGHNASLDGSFGGLGSHVARMIPHMPTISTSSGVETSSSAERRLVAGRQMFILNSQRFDAGLSFEVYVNGERWGATRPHPPADGLVSVQFPTEYTEPGDGAVDPVTAPPTDAVPAVTPPGQRRPSRAHEVLNAFAMTPVVAAWHRALLAALGDPAKVLPFARQGVKQLLNERSTLNRNRALMTGGDHEGGLTANGASMSLDLRITPTEVQYLRTTPNIAVRDDLGIVSSGGNATAGSSSVSADFQLLGYGLSYQDKPTAPNAKDNRHKGVFGGGVEVGSTRASGNEVGGEALNHTVLRRQSDQARYRVVFDAELTTTIGVRVEPVRVTGISGEVAVPEAERSDFERSLIGTDAERGRRYPAARPPVTPVEQPTPAATVDATLGPRSVTAPQTRPSYQAPPGPREPLGLVTRQGMGGGVVVGLPGSEAVAETIVGALRTASGARNGIGERATTVVNARAGRPALEADFTRAQAGDPFTVTVGGQDYDVLVLAHLRDRITDTSYPMDVNQRALHGGSISGSLGKDGSVEASLAGAAVFALPNDVRLQAGRVEAGARYSAGDTDKYADTIKHYRRTETTGEVTEYAYNVAYEVVVREVGAPRTTYLINDPDRAVGQIAVPQEHAAATPVTARQRDAAGRAQVSSNPPRGWDEDHVPFDTAGSSGTYPFFLTMPDVVAQAAQNYGRLNKLGDDWFAEPLNWPRPLWKAGIPTELAAHFAQTTGLDGWVIPLPDHDGRHQAVVVRTQIGANPQHLGASTSTEIEHYVQSAPGQEQAHKTKTIFGAGAGVGLLVSTGGSSEAHHTDGRPTRRAAGPGGGSYGSGGVSQDGDGNLINIGFAAGGEASSATSVPTEQGNIDITRATYNATVHSYRGRPTVEVTAVRWTGQGRNVEAERSYVTVPDGVDFIIPNRQAHELGLPGTTPVAPNQTPARQIVDPALTRAVGHPELVRADEVLPAIIQELAAHGLVPEPNAAGAVPPTPLVQALVERFSDWALESQYFALTGTGILMWYPFVTPDAQTRYLAVQVRATPRPAAGDLDRGEVGLTLRGEGHHADSVKHERGRGRHVDVKFRARGGLPTGGDLAGESEAGWKSESSHDHGDGTEVKDIFRVGVKKSHEFTLPLDFSIELGVTNEKPEILRVISSSVRESLFAASLGHAAPRRLWYDWRPISWDWQASPAAGGGTARLLVPAYLTHPVGSPGAWQPTAPPAPAASPPVRWDNTALASAHNQALLSDETLHPWTVLPVAEAMIQWTALAAEPPRRRPDGLGLQRPDASRVPGRGPLSEFGLAVRRHATDSMLRPRIGQLLRHDYTIPGTGTRAGLDIRNVHYYEVPEPDSPAGSATGSGAGSATGSGAGSATGSAAGSAAGRPLQFEHKGRSYRQTAQTPSHESSSGSDWQFSAGLLGRGPVGSDSKMGTGQVPGFGFSKESGHEATSSNVAERNSEMKRSYYLYRYDATLVLYGPSGDPLRIDLDQALYASSAQRPAITQPAPPTQPTEPVRFTPAVQTANGIELGERIDTPARQPSPQRRQPVIGAAPVQRHAPASAAADTSRQLSPQQLLTPPEQPSTAGEMIELDDLAARRGPLLRELDEIVGTDAQALEPIAQRLLKSAERESRPERREAIVADAEMVRAVQAALSGPPGRVRRAQEHARSADLENPAKLEWVKWLWRLELRADEADRQAVRAVAAGVADCW